MTSFPSSSSTRRRKRSAQHLTLEHAADVRCFGGLTALEQLHADGRYGGRKLLCRVDDDVARHRITRIGSGIDELGIGGDQRPRKLCRVEAMHQIVCIAAPFLPAASSEARCQDPSLLRAAGSRVMLGALDRIRRLHRRKCSPIRPRERTFDSHSDRTAMDPVPGNTDHPRLPCGRAGQRDHGIGCRVVIVRPN